MVRGATLNTVERLLNTERPDALHAHGARSMFVARSLLAAKRAGVRTVFTPHCFYPAQDWLGKVKRLIFDKTLGRAALKTADSIIALTEIDRDDAVTLGAEAARVTIVPNLSVGRLDRVKRGDFLIRALPHLPRDLSMVFIGPDAGCRSAWQALANELGLQRAVHFLGEVPDYDLKAAYQACSALALASKYEGLPTVILEAMALGAPVVASATGGTCCLVQHGENGLLFAYDNTAEFVAATQIALGTGKAAITERARKMVTSEYSWKVNIPKICSLYEIRAEMEEGEACVLVQ